MSACPACGASGADFRPDDSGALFCDRCGWSTGADPVRVDLLSDADRSKARAAVIARAQARS
jgi:hypothetical protein